MIKRILLPGLLFSATAQAFTSPASRVLSTTQTTQQWTSFPLKAEGNAPQYEKIDAVLTKSEVLGKGNVLLHVETTDKDVVLDYQPGHVLALELQDTSDVDDGDEDTQNNGGWMRAPYTISRATEHSFDIVMRVVGKKSKAFADAPENTPVRFGGKFKVPILEGIIGSSNNNNNNNNREQQQVKQVLLISTGVGAGPCIGAIEQALQDPAFPPIALLSSYREADEVMYQEHLDQLAKEYPSKFQWQPIITSEMGRLSSSSENMKPLTNLLLQQEGGLSIQDTHYHLIGNGQMVNEWQAGLEKAAVPNKRVTIEMYFNHKAETDDTAINNIASAVKSACSIGV